MSSPLWHSPEQRPDARVFLKASARDADGENAVPDAPLILVVEDDLLLKELLEDALAAGGFEVVFVASSETAMDLLRRGEVKCNALATDIHLREEMNGWQLAVVARQMEPTLPVVYMTAASGGEWAAQGVPNSILLQKPFAPAQLVTAVSQLLNKGSSFS
jgi:CheY-like chemotaxis protein